MSLLDDDKTIVIGIGSLLIVAIIVVIAITSNCNRSTHCIDILDGYWEAPVKFCNKAGIKSAQVYFNPKTNQIYFLMEGEDSIMLNKCVKFETQQNLSSMAKDYIEYTFKTDEEIDPLPQEMTLRVNPVAGFVGFHDKGTLHLELYKNNKASNGII